MQDEDIAKSMLEGIEDLLDGMDDISPIKKPKVETSDMEVEEPVAAPKKPKESKPPAPSEYKINFPH